MTRDDKTHIVNLADLGKEPTHASRQAYLIEISGRHVGRSHKLETEHLVIGRSQQCDILIDDDGVSRRHAVLHVTPSNEVTIVDNASTNGVSVNGNKIHSHLLTDGDRVQIGANTILKFSYQDRVEESYQKSLYDSATRDGLTGAFNKKYFMEQLRAEFAYSYRHGIQLSLLLFDIDYFKKLNDTWGHPAGDFVLRNLAQHVQQTLRLEDLFARYGGEEFAVLLRETDAEKALYAAERVRSSIESYVFSYEGQRLPVTVSVGGATLTDKNLRTPDDLIREADQFLYQAKRAGRNRVIVAHHPVEDTRSLKEEGE